MAATKGPVLAEYLEAALAQKQNHRAGVNENQS